MPGNSLPYVYAFDQVPADRGDALTRLLGGKGANLAVMASTLALPVPAGFTITTEACRAYLGGRWPDGLDAEIEEQMRRLGERIDRSFGDPHDPLLVSVRSGAPVSMPGMMDTILNLGLNAATTAGLARVVGDEPFAADCLRRFGEGYRQVVGPLEPPDDPWRQLRTAIEAVFRSWNSERARTYRRREGISDDLGTAVTVQAMVFGNRDADSGTGVLFTRNPSTGERALYGDILFGAQGEDVVAGGHSTQPLAKLDDRLPSVAAELKRHAELLERHHADMCDIEFTIEHGRLWILQVRVGKRSPQAALRMAIEMATDPAFPCSREEAARRVASQLADPPRVFVHDGPPPPAIANGLPASPGVAAGSIVTSPDAAEAASAEGRPVILVRPETSPEDVRGMAVAAGILTSRGGLTSHAAVVARGWGIPAVVGVESVRVAHDEVEIDGRPLPSGEWITIDGSSGEVYLAELAGHWEIAPEAVTLLEWAAELGIEPSGDREVAIGSEVADARPTAKTLTPDDLLRVLLVKGRVTTSQLAEALRTTDDDVEPLAAPLVTQGLLESTDGMLRLTDAGKLSALAAFAADRKAVGEPRTNELLDAFHAFDQRVKGIVTAWQVHVVDDEQTLNDHTDARYDAAVLEDLATLHADTVAWLQSLSAILPRFDAYADRLARALELAQGGDQRFVASPRVDSYHGVWFELHEDLMRVAGRRRTDEAAAGRA